MRPGEAPDDHFESPAEAPRPRSLAWLWPVAAGLAFGAVGLAPYTRSPGDPSGHVIGAGLGGGFGLVGAFVWRYFRRNSHT